MASFSKMLIVGAAACVFSTTNAVRLTMEDEDPQLRAALDASRAEFERGQQQPAFPPMPPQNGDFESVLEQSRREHEAAQAAQMAAAMAASTTEQNFGGADVDEAVLEAMRLASLQDGPIDEAAFQTAQMIMLEQGINDEDAIRSFCDTQTELPVNAVDMLVAILSTSAASVPAPAAGYETAFLVPAPSATLPAAPTTVQPNAAQTAPSCTSATCIASMASTSPAQPEALSPTLASAAPAVESAAGEALVARATAGARAALIAETEEQLRGRLPAQEAGENRFQIQFRARGFEIANSTPVFFNKNTNTVNDVRLYVKKYLLEQGAEIDDTATFGLKSGDFPARPVNDEGETTLARSVIGGTNTAVDITKAA